MTFEDLNRRSTQTIKFPDLDRGIISDAFHSAIRDLQEGALCSKMKMVKQCPSSTYNITSVAKTSGVVTLTLDNRHYIDPGQEIAVAGTITNGLHFNGTDNRVSTTVNNLFAGANKFSAMFLAKADVDVTTGMYLISASYATTVNGWYIMFTNPNTIRVGINNAGNAYGECVVANIQDLNFFEVYYDYAAGGTNALRLVIKINGAQQTLSFSGSIPATIGANSTPVPMLLGAHTQPGLSYVGFFDGLLSKVCIYSDAVQANGVAMYNSGRITEPVATNLVRYYKFAETDPSTVATDTQGIDNGTLVNFDFDDDSGRVATYGYTGTFNVMNGGTLGEAYDENLKLQYTNGSDSSAVIMAAIGTVTLPAMYRVKINPFFEGVDYNKDKASTGNAKVNKIKVECLSVDSVWIINSDGTKSHVNIMSSEERQLVKDQNLLTSDDGEEDNLQDFWGAIDFDGSSIYFESPIDLIGKQIEFWMRFAIPYIADAHVTTIKTADGATDISLMDTLIETIPSRFHERLVPGIKYHIYKAVSEIDPKYDGYRQLFKAEWEDVAIPFVRQESHKRVSREQIDEITPQGVFRAWRV